MYCVIIIIFDELIDNEVCEFEIIEKIKIGIIIVR
jgi:hypothetical protein